MWGRPPACAGLPAPLLVQQTQLGRPLCSAVAVVSIGTLYAFDSPGLAGITYMFIGPILTVYGAVRGKQRRKRYEDPAR